MGRIFPVERESLSLPKGRQKGQELLKLCWKGKCLVTGVVVAERFPRRSLKRLREVKKASKMYCRKASTENNILFFPKTNYCTTVPEEEMT